VLPESEGKTDEISPIGFSCIGGGGVTVLAFITIEVIFCDRSLDWIKRFVADNIVFATYLRAAGIGLHYIASPPIRISGK
jgi:hypothetical protein